MAIKVFNSVHGFSVGEDWEQVIDSNANITANILTVTANANVANLSASGSVTATGNVTGGNITTAGNISGNDISLSGGAWTTYTPTWTAASSNPSIGNGTLTGRYKIIGKTCFITVDITMGSTTTYGSGAWYIGLPQQAASSAGILLSVTLLDSGTAWYNALLNGARAAFTDKAEIQYHSGVNLTDSVSSSTPFTWANSDRVIINGSYEIS